MTLEEFISIAEKKEATVKKWIKEGLVNGASYTDGEYVISDMARPPYTRASNKTSAGIRKGIVVGCKRRLSVNAKIFKISDYEFSVYADQLIEAEFIERRVVDGNTYYYSTPKADTLTENQIYLLMKDWSAAMFGAATGTAVEKMMGK